MQTSSNIGAAVKPPSHEINLVVCCAFGDLTDVRKVEGSLAEEGVHVHLVPGIDRDLEGMAVHLLADGEPTIFAVAHSAAMPSDPLEALIALFGRQRGPEHRLCVVEFDRSHPDKFIRAVRESVAKTRVRMLREAQAPAPRTLPTSPHAVVQGSTGPQQSLGGSPRPANAWSSDDNTPPPDLECLLLDGVVPSQTDSAETMPDLRSVVQRVKRAEATRNKRRWLLAALVSVVLAAVATVSLQVMTEEDTVSESKVATAPLTPQADPSGTAAPIQARAPKTVANLEMLPASERTMSFTTARIRCARKASDDGNGWRVPTIEQLRSLHEADALPPGTFWSATHDENGDRLTLSRDGSEAVLAGSTREGAHVVCVRPR